MTKQQRTEISYQLEREKNERLTTETAALRAEIERLKGEPVRFAEWMVDREVIELMPPFTFAEMYALFTDENAGK